MANVGNTRTQTPNSQAYNPSRTQRGTRAPQQALPDSYVGATTTPLMGAHMGSGPILQQGGGKQVPIPNAATPGQSMDPQVIGQQIQDLENATTSNSHTTILGGAAALVAAALGSYGAYATIAMHIGSLTGPVGIGVVVGIGVGFLLGIAAYALVMAIKKASTNKKLQKKKAELQQLQATLQAQPRPVKASYVPGPPPTYYEANTLDPNQDALLANTIPEQPQEEEEQEITAFNN